MKRSLPCLILLWLIASTVTDPVCARCILHEHGPKMIIDGVQYRYIRDSLDSSRQIVLEAGTPNYAQSDFAGDNDCGPTAAAMLLGHWDANGWPCMIRDDGPYIRSDPQPDSGLARLVRALQKELPYSGSIGTPPARGLDLVSSGLQEVVRTRAPGASWHTDEDEFISYSDVRAAIDADRPLMFLVRVGGWELCCGTNAQWDGAGGRIGSKFIDWHWMTTIGYRHIVEGERVFGDCVDWLNDDEFWFISRGGWNRGGDSRIWYHTYFWDAADLYTVEVTPGGDASTCTDPEDEDGDGHATTYPSVGRSAGDDCDDARASVYPGAPEIADGLDNDCDGWTETGAWTGAGPCPGGPEDARFSRGSPTDLDAHENGVYLSRRADSPLAMAVDSVRGFVVSWWGDGVATTGDAKNLHKVSDHSGPLTWKPAEGKRREDLLAVGMGTFFRVWAYYRDGTFSHGTPEDLEFLRRPVATSCRGANRPMTSSLWPTIPAPGECGPGTGTERSVKARQRISVLT